MTKKKKATLIGGVIILVAVATLASSTLTANAHKSKPNGDRKAIIEVIEANDYNAFKEAAEGKKIGEIVENQDEFNKLVEAHNLKQEARKLMEEIGFEKRPHHHWNK